jgi:hypothetical protein
MRLTIITDKKSFVNTFFVFFSFFSFKRKFLPLEKQKNPASKMKKIRGRTKGDLHLANPLAII